MPVEIRCAGADDNDAILGFLSDHAMQAGLDLRFDRSPDFFALPIAHSPHNETWLGVDGGRLVGLGSCVFRDGYIDERIERVAYVGDLRVDSNRHVAGRWRARLAARLAEVGHTDGLRFGYCAVIRDNRLARNAVRRRHSGDALRFVHLRGYSNVSILARKPWAKPIPKRVKMRRATVHDADQVRQFVDAESRRQSFGVVFDKEAWQRRLALWPDLGIERFVLAFDEPGRLVGCIAPWNYAALKRIVIDAMPAGVRALRGVYNLLAPLTGRPVLRGRPCVVPDVALSHLTIADRDADVLAALLDAAWRDVASGRHFATATLCLYDGDPLWAAMDRFWYHAVPMDLYVVCLAQHADTAETLRARFPGFEIYLV